MSYEKWREKNDKDKIWFNNFHQYSFIINSHSYKSGKNPNRIAKLLKKVKRTATLGVPGLSLTPVLTEPEEA